MNSKILKSGIIIGVGTQIMFVALVLFSDNFRANLSNLLKNNMMISAVFYLGFTIVKAIDIILLMIAPFAYLLFLIPENKKSSIKS